MLCFASLASLSHPMASTPKNQDKSGDSDADQVMTGQKRKKSGRTLRVTDNTEQSEMSIYHFDLDEIPSVLRRILESNSRVYYLNQCDGFEELIDGLPVQDEDDEDEESVDESSVLDTLEEFFGGLPDKNRCDNNWKKIDFDYEIGLVAY